MRRLGFVSSFALLLMVSAACGGGGTSGSGSGGGVTGTIRGTVTSGPQCPVAIAGSPCPDRPWEGTVDVRSTDGTTVDSATTSPDGTFTVAVAPGTYDLVARTQGMGPPTARAVRVTVASGATTNVELTVDTGIR